MLSRWLWCCCFIITKYCDHNEQCWKPYRRFWISNLLRCWTRWRAWIRRQSVERAIVDDPIQGIGLNLLLLEDILFSFEGALKCHSWLLLSDCIYPIELGLNDGALKYLPRAIPKAASKDVSIEFLTNYGGDVDVGKQAFPYLLFDEITITSLH